MSANATPMRLVQASDVTTGAARHAGDTPVRRTGAPESDEMASPDCGEEGHRGCSPRGGSVERQHEVPTPMPNSVPRWPGRRTERPDKDVVKQDAQDTRAIYRK